MPPAGPFSPAKRGEKPPGLRPRTPWGRAAAGRNRCGSGRVPVGADAPGRLLLPLRGNSPSAHIGPSSSDGSALSVTLHLFATRSLFPAPPEMPPGFAWPVFRPARLTVPLLTTAPRFCVGAALVAARGRVWAPAPTSLYFLPSHMAAAPLAPTPHATQGADIHSIHRA